MASVREYLRFRRKRERPERSINYKERIRGHKLTIFYRGVLAAVLAAAVVGMAAVSWQNREYAEGLVISSIPVSKVEGATYLALGNNILTYSKDGANCMDGRGIVLWNQTYEMQNPMVDINGSVVAIGDYNGRTIYVMDAEGSRGEITTNLPIRKFRVAANGVVAVILYYSKINRKNLYTRQKNLEN